MPSIFSKNPLPRRVPSWWDRTVNAWFDRLFTATKEGTWSEQDARTRAGETRKDYIWNTAGLAVWGMMFPLFTILVTQLSGTEKAGMFSLAFVTSQVLMIVANFGVRAYQASDVEERHSFLEYQVVRWVTCVVMLLVGFVFFSLRGYSGEMHLICMGILVYRAIDCLADVYEGRLQQKDKLYLAGMSQTLRSAISFIIFTLLLLLGGNIGAACIGMALAAGASFVLFTLPITLFETKGSHILRPSHISAIFRQCWPLFAAMFLYTLTDNVPKFAIDGLLDYTSQLYFNALYFPAQFVLIVGGFIYKPLIVRMADAWADVSQRETFTRFVRRVALAIGGVTVGALVFFAFLGIPLFGMLYGIDFESMRALCLLMIVAGGFTGGIDFLYQVMTVVRNQNAIIRSYLVAFAVALVASIALICLLGLLGAVVAYLVTMGLLFVSLVLEYLRIAHGGESGEGGEGGAA